MYSVDGATVGNGSLCDLFVARAAVMAAIVGEGVGSSGLFVSFVTTMWPSAMRSAIFGGMSTETVARWIDSMVLFVVVLLSLPFLRWVS
jgi:hypothetical protein